MTDQEHNHDDLPELRDALSGSYRSEVPVPPEIDQAVLRTARRRFAFWRRRRFVIRWAAAGAMAAAVMLAVLLTPQYRHQPEEAAPEVASAKSLQSFSKEDIDRNGRVDILDAFVLARRIEGAGKAEAEWDVNGDGAVNRTDVDTVAMAAVRLKGRRFQ